MDEANSVILLRPSVLAEILRRNDSTELQQIAIIDVREEDRIGGHIRCSEHIPASTFDIEVDKLLERVKSYKMVVFYCQHSQVRSPDCCRKFKERLNFFYPESSLKPVVLRHGFQGWVCKFGGEDALLVEDFEPVLWQKELSTISPIMRQLYAESDSEDEEDTNDNARELRDDLDFSLQFQ